MRKIIVLVLSFMAFAPDLVLAAGYYTPGKVRITEVNGYYKMEGQMNTRYNEESGDRSFVSASKSFGSGVLIIAQSDGPSTKSVYFSCYVPTSDPYFKEAVDLQRALDNGALLYATKKKDEYNCQQFYMGNHSFYLD